MFLHKSVLHGSLTLPFRGVSILASRSWRYSYLKNDSPLSTMRAVDDSPYQWYAESLTPCIVDTGSRLLNFLKENSPYRWYGKSSTPRISDTVSRRLPVSLSPGVGDSAYHWFGELTTLRIFESGSRHSPYWWVWESLSDKIFYNKKWMRSSRLWMRSSRMWMRSSRVVDEI